MVFFYALGNTTPYGDVVIKITDNNSKATNKVKAVRELARYALPNSTSPSHLSSMLSLALVA